MVANAVMLAPVAVNVAVYVPSLLSVTVPIVPSAVPLPSANRTVEPPVVSELPAASFAVSVIVAVPAFATDVGAMLTSDCDRLADPGVTVMFAGAEVSACALIVAAIVFVPAMVPVNVAV